MHSVQYNQKYLLIGISLNLKVHAYLARTDLLRLFFIRHDHSPIIYDQSADQIGTLQYQTFKQTQ